MTHEVSLRKLAHISVFMNDGSSVSVHIDEQDRLLFAWKSGGTFIECRGVWGQPCYIKLRDVNMINIWDQEHLDIFNHDRLVEKEEDKKEEML